MSTTASMIGAHGMGSLFWCTGLRIFLECDRCWLGANHIRDGASAFCGEKIPGRFENEPDRWCARRLLIRMD